MSINSVNKHSEVEVLKEELNFLTDLLKGHKAREAYYPKPHFYNVPYGNLSVYSGKGSAKSTNLNSLSVYKSKYNTNRTSFKNHFDDRTGKIPTSRSFVQKSAPVSSFPKQSTSYSIKQNALWKHNKASSCTQNLPSSFKMVRASGSANVSNIHSKTQAVASSAKVVPSGSIPASGNKHGTNVNTNSVRVTKGNNLPKPTSSKKDNHQPTEKSTASKHRKGVKVSYVPCSDCIIEILEYENGELHISQKKLDPSVQDDEESAFIGDSPVKIPKSSLSDTVCKKDSAKRLCPENQHTSEHNSVHQKPCTGCDSSTGTTISSAVETDIKLSNISSLSQSNVPSLCKLAKSQQPCARNAKYSKVNVSTSKSQNSVAKPILKTKYSVKKSNLVKCKINKELKGCTPNSLKYPGISKSSSQKCLVSSYSAKRIVLPVRNVNKRTVYTSYSSLNSLRQNHARSKVTKSIFPTPLYTKISKKAKASHMQSVYKVVNKPNHVAGSSLKGSHLCKKISENKPSGLALRNCDESSNKKWFKSNGGAMSVPLNASAQQNLSNTAAKSETKNILHGSLPQKMPSCELKNARTSKIITRHSLQRVLQKKSIAKKPGLNLSPRLFSDGHNAIKKAKKVRLSKTTYKVVNRYADHVSQVVQMIKTKYRTVNKRSASNSHLKWLQEQKRSYLARKLGKSEHSHPKAGWAYHHHSSVKHHARKHPVLKASRKHSMKQNKVLKNIYGVTYKVSKTQIKKSFTPKRIKKSRFALCNKKNSVINVHGTKFQMSPGGKSLKRLGTNREGNKTSPRRIKIGGFTYVQQKEGSSCLVKSPSMAQNVASRMLHRSINTVRAAAAKKTLQKNNMFCMFFNRFGKCNKEGNCPYIHDPSKIAVCTRFLRGTCKISGCPFSHEISPGKMAICSYFLQGNCTKDNCPYQHTSIKPGTRLCKAFVKGYCNKGSECQDAHILACPQLICEGFCEKVSCIWPHPPIKNNIRKRNDPPEAIKEIKEKDAAADEVCDQRYFTYEPGLVSDKYIKHTESVAESIHCNAEVTKIRNKKIAFPKQPEYIPLLS